MGLSAQLEEAMAGGPPDPNRVTGSAIASQLNWNLQGLKLMGITWDVLHRLMKNMKDEEATKQEVDNIIGHLEDRYVNDKKTGKRLVKKIQTIIIYLKNSRKHLK
jgi:hypothetical protein